MFLLNFRVFADTMFLAGTTENQCDDGNCGGDFANTKMHNALGQYSDRSVSRKMKAALFLYLLVFFLLEREQIKSQRNRKITPDRLNKPELAALV
jgi:hypothetical protein